MKHYEPREMAASSRYQKFFPTLPAAVQEGICSRMKELLIEEKLLPAADEKGCSVWLQ